MEKFTALEIIVARYQRVLSLSVNRYDARLGRRFRAWQSVQDRLQTADASFLVVHGVGFASV